MKASDIGECLPADTFTRPSVKAHTTFPLDSDWFSLCTLTPDRELFVWLIARRIRARASAEKHVTDWLHHGAIILTSYSLVDAPALNHQHATPISLSLSLSLSPSLSSSSNIPHAVSTHLCWRLIFCGINFSLYLTLVRCQVSYRLSPFLCKMVKGFLRTINVVKKTCPCDVEYEGLKKKKINPDEMCSCEFGLCFAGRRVTGVSRVWLDGKRAYAHMDASLISEIKRRTSPLHRNCKHPPMWILCTLTLRTHGTASSASVWLKAVITRGLNNGIIYSQME